MQETGIDFCHGSKHPSYITARKRSEADAIQARLDEYGYKPGEDYTREDYYIQDEWDAARFTFCGDVLRLPRMLIRARRAD